MIIDIGSGPHPKPDSDVRMDMYDWPSVNCKHDLLKVPYPFESGTFDKAYMGDVIEHIYIFNVNEVLTEVNRIIKVGGILEVCVPDVRWICERIVKGDWWENANVEWLNPTADPWKNAMSYLFGGFHNAKEYNMLGMGHVNGFDENSLSQLLMNNGFGNCQRVPDYRNPLPARNSVLKIICEKL